MTLYHVCNCWARKRSNGRPHFCTPIRNVLFAPLDFVVGLHSGFPVCCVMEFSLRHLIGFPKLIIKVTGIGPGRYYIPCTFHENRHPWRKIHLCKGSERKFCAVLKILEDRYITFLGRMIPQYTGVAQRKSIWFTPRRPGFRNSPPVPQTVYLSIFGEPYAYNRGPRGRRKGQAPHI